jgi:hypothetical protein
MGRELATTYVETKSELNPLTLLFARSGIGKSSFLTSRLVPDLRVKHPIIYLNEWGGRKPEAIVVEGLDRLNSVRREDGPCGYLVLDQFEDVFKQELDRRPLWENLCETVNAGQTETRIIITMREEWLGAWAEVEQYIPTAFSSMVRLAPLTPKELRRAIVRPIEIEGQVRIDQDVVDTLLVSLRQQNAYGLGEGLVEPGLLQLVCQRLWEEAASSGNRIDQALYGRLGGASSIVRDFVWRHLRDDSSSTDVFTADQRVLWAGLTRHLSVAHGVKAVVTADMLARKLQIKDLGIAGPAVSAGKGIAVLKYLKKPVEGRSAIPSRLTNWISETLEVGHSFGFLKKQEGYGGTNPHSRLYELSHDSLDIFRLFSLEFEKWLAKRVYIFWSLIFVLFFVVPYFTMIVLDKGILEALFVLVVMVFAAAIYLGLLWVLILVAPYIAALIYYPIVRRLTRGSIKAARND